MAIIRSLAGICLAAVLVASALSFGCGRGEHRPKSARQTAAAPHRGPHRLPSERLNARNMGEFTLAGSELRSHTLELEAGQAVHLIVDQDGIDVTVAVYAPGHGHLFTVDSPNGTKGLEHVYLVADATGEFQFDVEAVAGAERGRYCTRIALLRPARAGDLARAEAESAFSRGRVAAETEPPPWQAAAELEHALRLFTRLGLPERRAYTSYLLGQLYIRRSRPAAAITLFLDAIALYRRLPASRDTTIALAGSYNELGRAYGRLPGIVGSTERAEASYRRALHLFSAARYPVGQARALNNLGVLALNRDDFREALADLGAARELWHRLAKREEEAKTLQNLGMVYNRAADYPQAVRMHKQAIELLHDSADGAQKAAALVQLANALLASDEPRAALSYYLRVGRAQKGGALAATAYSGIGLCYRRLGDYGAAIDSYRRALQLLEKTGDKRALGTVWLNLGATYGRMGQPETANKCYLRALALAREARYPFLEAMSRFGMAVEARDRGNLLLARQYCDRALAIVEALRIEAARPDLQASYLALHEPYYGLMIELLMEQQRRDGDPELAVRAFEWSEKARARSMLDALKTPRFPRSDREAAPLLAEYRALAQAISAKDQERRSPGLSAAQGEAIDGAIDDLLERSRQLAQRLALPDRLAGAPASSAASAVQLLDPDTVLLEFYLGERASFLWVVAPGAPVRSIVLPKRGDLEPSIRNVYSLLSLPHADDGGRAATKAAGDLSRQLLGSIAPGLGRRRLVIVSNGALQTIPFTALPDPAARGELLGDRHEIVYLPSASVFTELRRRSSRPPGPIALLADPVVSRDDPRLPAAARGTAEDELRRLANAGAEAEAILALPWRHRGLRRLGFDADRDLVMSGKLRTFPILHIAAHGLVRLDHPELSALVLSRFDRAGRPRDGYLRLRDLAALDLPAELVVLSACRTALGREVAGEGLLGLGQGFLAAGARRVLVSLWDVDDPATAALMAHFYRSLQTLPPGAALRAAQAAVRADPAWQEPYYWAGFVLQGDWR